MVPFKGLVCVVNNICGAGLLRFRVLTYPCKSSVTLLLPVMFRVLSAAPVINFGLKICPAVVLVVVNVSA